MPKRILVISKKQPARAIVLVVCLLTLIAGIFMFTPFYGPIEATPLFGGPVDSIGLLATATINVLVSLPGLIGGLRNKQAWLAWGAFSMFVWYLFIALTRAAIFPYPGRLMWLPSFMLSLVMGIIYLEQKNRLHIKVVVGPEERDGDLD